ncbi:putative ABC transport system permease protein [Saccharothrix tamanrassetensis]|uniref:Putative ABC transport system permease protein n=1 Tax=Saccharothrix tamanrassetensis TaxID=1051531 RepID=A0A841CI79_9PSEU|nr:FtsX-like permease family protein [Saccharothrix tamanrassetensis]MBB5955837.1 putative ABC transport system permease protein [Saccharothrix tamanrassetensis]
MLRTIIAGLRARTARLVLSSVAIALGVAFVTGTLVLGDAMNASMRDEFAKSARGVDVSVYLSGGGGDVKGITPETLEKVRQAPGVAGADARAFQQVPLIATNGKAKPAFAVPLAATEELREYDLADGRYPSGVDEIAADVRTAETAKLSIGKTVTLLGKDDQKREYTLVGTYKQGVGEVSMSGNDHLVLTPEAYTAFNPERLPYQVVAVAADGFTQQQVADNVRKALGSDIYTVQTGEQLTEDTLRQVSSQSAQFTTFLLAFAAISLVVAAMVIYNTFTILVAQRTRELALMRCVGASRKQVFRGVLAEALVMGLAASVIGLLGGLGVSALLQKVIGGFGGGADAPVRVPVTATTVLVAFAVGVVVTVLAAVLPARKATRVAPVAALRSQLDSSEEVSRTGKLRVLFAVLLGVGGAGTILMGMRMEGEEAPMFVSGAGTMLLLAAVLVLGPLLVGPVNRVLGALPRALFGVPAKLASANAGRNPKRTAATTAALMIGVTVVAMVTVVANSAKETANAQVDQRLPADYTVTSSVYDRPLPVALAEQLAAVPEVAKVAPTTQLMGDRGYFTGVSKDALGDLFRPTVESGALGDLREGTIALNAGYAEEQGLAVGSTTTVKTGNGSQELKVVALISGQRLADGVVTLETSAKLDPVSDGYDSIMVKLEPGVANGRAAVEKITDASPLAVIDSAAETKAQLNEQLDKVLAFVWALIGLAVVIALFGIANTLTLSVLERTRESALLRALGLTKGQLRLMLVVESILMALMGAAIGLVLGVGFGWVITKALSSDTLELAVTIPFGQIGVMLAAAVVAAVLAAALPARRAARTSVVAGMAEA